MFARPRVWIGLFVLSASLSGLLVTTFARSRADTAGQQEGADGVQMGSSQFESPASVYAAFRQALASQDWSGEYACYAPRQQARFSHMIVVAALYLEFHMDLYLEVEAALARHGVTDEDLAGFWPRATYAIVDEGDPQGCVDRAQLQYASRLEQWQREVLPKIRDCGGLLATLLPLLREGVRRNPESTVALVFQNLDGFAYGRLQEVDRDGDRATGQIRVKSRFGAFVELDHLEPNDDEDSSGSDASQPAAESSHVVLDEASGLYCWMWEVAHDIQTLARSVRRPRMVIVGLPTGDVSVAPLEIKIR